MRTPSSAQVAVMVFSRSSVANESSVAADLEWSKRCAAADRYFRNPVTGMSGSGPVNL